MSNTLIWAHTPLPDLDNQTGFVECSEELAAKLISSGAAQSLDVGGHLLKEIVASEPATYITKEIAPKRGPGRPRKSEDASED